MSDFKAVFITIGSLVLLYLGILAFEMLLTPYRWITDEKAIVQIKEITGAGKIVIIHDSGNDNIAVHEITDVTFDVWLYYSNEKRERAQFRCTDGLFSDLVCRGYENE